MSFRFNRFRQLCALVGLVLTAGALSEILPQRSRDESARRVMAFEREWTEFFLPRSALIHARWGWGRLVGIEDNKSAEPLLYSVPKDGPIERIRLAIPEAGFIFLVDIAGGSDGAVALSGSCYDQDGKGSTFVAWISPDRQHQTVIRTWPYVPHRLAIAADGVIWTAGWVRNPPAENVVEYNVFKRFDSSGNILSSFTSVGRGSPTGLRGDAVPLSSLRASRDRIGWMTGGREYVEFSLDGKEIGRFEGPRVPSLEPGGWFTFALSENNQVLVGIDEPGLVGAKRVGAARWSLWELDRVSQVWLEHKVTGADHPGQGRLLGFDGETVLILDEHFIVRSFRLPGG